MGILFNITIYFDNGGVQDNNLALSDLRVSLMDKAYASAGGNCPTTGCNPYNLGGYCGSIGSEWICFWERLIV